MTIKAHNGIYQIEIPPSYRHEYSENILSIFNGTKGVGAMSISGYIIPQDYNFIGKDELQNFIQSIDNAALLIDIDVVDCTTENCSAEFMNSKGRYWKVWVLFSNNRAAFISYNCDNSEKHIEEDAINNLVHSINFIG